MKRGFLLLFNFFISLLCMAQIDSINQRIFLVGDAGELLGNTHPVIDWLKKNVDWNDEKNTVIFLGDNIYPLGMPMEGDPSYPQSKKIIDYQIGLVKGKKARAYFIMGNHDWKNGKLGGWQQAMNQQNYINSLELPNVQALPINGCPGPEEVILSDKVVAVLLDSEWFLYLHDKPGPGSDCETKTLDEFMTAFREIVASHPNQLLVVALHHPIRSYGIHGGDFSWKNYIFPFTDRWPRFYVPLPILGVVYPLARGYFGTLQDVHHPLYQTLTNSIEEVMKTHRFPVQVAGHEHSLQLIVKDSVPFVVSGSASNLTRVKHGKFTVYSKANYGFSTLEVRKSGKTEVKFYTLQSTDLSHPDTTVALKTIVPDTVSRTSIDTLAPLPDYVKVIANPKLKGNGLRRMFIGKNYRKEWTQEITVPVLDMGKEMGGLKPVRQGGGKQTKSLRVADTTGKEWTLRSIEKFPEAAIPPDLRTAFAKDIVEDGISASYPYAALSMRPITNAARVPDLRRKLVYIPDDPRLDRFQKTFKNTLAILEEREPQYTKKTYNTDDLVLRLAKDNDDHVDQKAVLRARLVDNFVMDLDRHEDQWRWATRDTGKGKLYYPIPRDHDQAFYTNQGILPFFAKKPWLAPELQGFRAEADNIKTFNRAARNFDRAFLNGLSDSDWHRQIDTFLSKMTDAIIDSSLHLQPKEVQPYSMQKIINTLKKRRKYFKEDMMEYYEFISKEVNIVGSNKKELFTITKLDGGDVHVVVNKIDKEGKVSSKIYERLFNAEVTKEIRIFGLEDDDSFVVHGGSTRMLIRIVGGPGKDHFVDSTTAAGRVLVYDVNFEENRFSGNNISFRKRISSDPQNNMYNRLYYRYDFINVSTPVEYNLDDGLFLGAGVVITKRGFRKEPYGKRYYFRANHAVQTSSYHFRGEADFIKVLKNTDLVIQGDVKAPINVTNFFGIGNNTEYDKSKPGKIKYYRARYNISDFSLLFRRQLQSWMNFSYGTSVQFFHLEEQPNKDRFVSKTAINGLDPKTLYSRKLFAGPELRLAINSKNSLVLPTRGAILNSYIRPMFGLNQASGNVTQVGLDLSFFMSIFTQKRIVVGERFGVGHNFGDFEFQQAQYLGGTENLRGYRKQRFAGRTMAFNNTEIRLKISDFNTYLFPGTVGLLAFHDIGRVWTDGENSRRWHTGYGGGVWIAPIRRFVLTACITASKEEKSLPLVTLGFQF